MSFSNSSDPQDTYQYHYPTQNTYNHYISDGSTVGTGDESNFWSNSPRSESPSPNSTLQNQIVGPYHIYTPISYSPEERHIYRSAYQTITTEADCVTHIGPPFVRVVKRRTTANKKERRRTQSINNAYADLRDCIPNVPADTKLSKIYKLFSKEKRRTQSINNAYADLRDCIPNVPADTKLSKIKTLRLATSYISYLTRALESDDPAGGFKAELGSITRKSASNPMQVNDCSTGQMSPKSNISEDMNVRKGKGRTGWPQHVWALELKQEQGM